MTDALPRSAVTGLVWPALPDSVGASLLAVHFQLAQSEWWSASRLAQGSRCQLAPLLRHARDTVPAHTRRLAGLPLDDADTVATHWQHVPLLRRADVQALGDDLHSRAVPADHGQVIEYHTSGSTGRPLRGIETELSHFFFGALNLREHLGSGAILAALLRPYAPACRRRSVRRGRAIEAVFPEPARR